MMKKQNKIVAKANTRLHAHDRPIRLKDDKVAAEFGDGNYKELENRKHAAFRKYIRDNKLNTTTNGLQLRRSVIISSTLKMDKDVKGRS
jgi:hypothetical protein